MNNKDFLVELGTEELPPKALKKLSLAFTGSILASLDLAEISYSGHQSFASPRRLALLIRELKTAQPDQTIERRGPAIEAAFDSQNNPTKAAEGFARSNGVCVDQLEPLKTEKGAYLVYRSIKQGTQTVSLLPKIIKQSISNLPTPKRMRWGARREEFVRPVHWLIMLYGNEIVNCEILGLKAGRESWGHRFHTNRTLTINQPSDYKKTLDVEGKVVSDFNERRNIIRKLVTAEAKKINNTAVICEDLLNEVTALVEWPVALSGQFDEAFLSVPAEALISSMKEHQKYFHVVDNKGVLQPFFITVSNIESKDPKQVILGNERVIRSRLTDAKFFFESDKKITLETQRERLKLIVFQAQLGSLFNKTERISTLAAWIVGQEKGNTEIAKRAGLLAKSDLVSSMVLEFPELQGIMGEYYAAYDGEKEETSKAINEHYMPRFSGDNLPSTSTSCALAIADKIDTIVGIFGIGQSPTGSKDPFGLRRSSIGVLRIIIDKKLNIDLTTLVEQATTGYKALCIKLPKANVNKTVVDYLLERFDSIYQEEGVSKEIINAVKELRPTRPLDFDYRIKAVCNFSKLSEAEALASANKRVSNMLSKSGGIFIPDIVDNTLLKEEEEINLVIQLFEKRKDILPLLELALYDKVMEILASLKEPIDVFFDKVLVNTEDEKIKLNRYAILKQLRNLFLHVADISLL
ncbi:MAG: glycine--tRNA ligase subunit beta [Candidatus Endonucleobacter bathymodioli]|uniref:Glycine--tRNA ligase beta subunit n=1 Tax=Candidatus Endonucleibacter bathymodioli TaxID=539814 RepID=A0AA90NJQ0_9GAMM|nr:glycine--tRNA ligase subunit beta [Candidatus Endonucleobacter bathymodioli]